MAETTSSNTKNLQSEFASALNNLSQGAPPEILNNSVRSILQADQLVRGVNSQPQGIKDISEINTALNILGKTRAVKEVLRKPKLSKSNKPAKNEFTKEEVARLKELFDYQENSLSRRDFLKGTGSILMGIGFGLAGSRMRHLPTSMQVESQPPLQQLSPQIKYLYPLRQLQNQNHLLLRQLHNQNYHLPLNPQNLRKKKKST